MGIGIVCTSVLIVQIANLFVTDSTEIFDNTFITGCFYTYDNLYHNVKK